MRTIIISVSEEGKDDVNISINEKILKINKHIKINNITNLGVDLNELISSFDMDYNGEIIQIKNSHQNIKISIQNDQRVIEKLL